MKQKIFAFVAQLFRTKKVVLKLNAVAPVVYLLPGSELKDGLSQTIEVAKALGVEVDFNCGNIYLEVNSDSTVEALYQQFQNEKVKPK